jgi:hypothetical protein
VTPLYPQTLAQASLTGGGRSVDQDPVGLSATKKMLLLSEGQAGEAWNIQIKQRSFVQLETRDREALSY